MKSGFDRVRHYLIILLTVALAGTAWPLAQAEEFDGLSGGRHPGFSEDGGGFVAVLQSAPEGGRAVGIEAPFDNPPTALSTDTAASKIVLAAAYELEAAPGNQAQYLYPHKTGPPSA